MNEFIMIVGVTLIEAYFLGMAGGAVTIALCYWIRHLKKIKRLKGF